MREDFRGKKILIVGLGKSGFAAASLLGKIGAKVWITEIRDTPQIRKYLTRLVYEDAELGVHTQNFIKNKDFAVLSPGIPLDTEIVQWLKKQHIPILGEIELGFRLCPATIIAITGTNGKSTVTSMVGEFLKRAKKRVFVVGNIGNPFSSEVLKMQKGDFVCLEVSSFQLELVDRFCPKIAIILNFSPDHLDRHKTLQDYLEAKKRIFLNQNSSDWTLLNYKDITVRNLAKYIRAKVLFFNRNEKKFNPNEAVLYSLAKILKIDEDTLFTTLKEFKPLPHRMESLGFIKGIEFINDSKSTNIFSCIWALTQVSRPIILIAGGKDKGLDFTPIKPYLRQKVKMIILFGEAKRRMYETFKGITKIKEVDFISEAVSSAFSCASCGEVVLFSPMCASFDMFRDFEERGEYFKECVKSLL